MAGMTDDSLDKLIRRSVEELDQKHPDGIAAKDKLWSLMKERRSQRKATSLVWMSVAATILVVVAFIVYAPSLTRVSPTLSNHYADSASLMKSDAFAFIDEYCHEKTIACNTPELRDLRLELEQSLQKLDEIDKQLLIYNNDLDLGRARDRVERHKTRVIKTIVQLL
jgi:hypothetical protein